MKATVLAAAAAMVAGQVSAASHGHRHAHRALFEKKGLDSDDGVCVPTCTTIYSTITGEPTRMLWPRSGWRRTGASEVTFLSN
jgi:hypothetical protein